MTKQIINKRGFLLLICFLSILPYCVVSYNNIPEAFYFSLVPIIVFLLINLFGNSYCINFVKLNRLNIFCVILSVLFIVMLSLSQIIGFIANIDNYIPVNNETIAYFYKQFIIVWSVIIYFPVLFICTYAVIRSIFEFGLKEKTTSRIKHITTGKLLIVISVVSLICLLSTYPGAIANPDVAGIWEEIVDPSLMTDWHPVGYIYFVSLCSKLFPSVYALNVVQTLIWIFLNFTILKFLEGIDKTLKASVFYTVVTILIFTPYAYLQVMLKDIIFGIMILGMTLFVLKFIKKIPSRGDVVFGIAMCAGTVLFRHAQLITFLGTMFVLVIWSVLRKDKKRILSLGAILLTVLLVYSGVQFYAFNIQGVEKNPKYVSYTVPLAMIGAAAANGVDFDEEDQAVLEEIMPIEKWADSYNKYLLDEVSRSWGKIGKDVYKLQEKVENEGYGNELIRINAKLALQHPIIYLTAFFDANTIVWEIGMPADSYVQGIQTYEEDTGSIKYFLPWGITGKIINFQSEMPILNNICTRGGIYLFILILSGLLLWLKNRKKDVIAFVPILLFTALLMLSIPAPQTRYILGTIECSILLLSYSFFVRSEKSDMKMADTGLYE